MDMQRMMSLVDTSHALNITLSTALREIDRRALNALVLVKRHGNSLAGYGVVAQAFRERAAFLKEASQEMRNYIDPAIQTQMRIMVHEYLAHSFLRVMTELGEKSCPTLKTEQQNWLKATENDTLEMNKLLQQLLAAVDRMQNAISEQEYVVVNGRIEAALSEDIGAPLTRVSQDMGAAVEIVSQAVQNFRRQLEESFI